MLNYTWKSRNQENICYLLLQTTKRKSSINGQLLKIKWNHKSNNVPMNVLTDPVDPLPKRKMKRKRKTVESNNIKKKGIGI